MSLKSMPQLAFNGNCKQAFEHYEKVFRGKIVVMNTFGENQDKALPPGSVEGGADKIRFAEVQIGENSSILGNDVGPNEFRPMHGFNISVHTDNVSEAQRIFKGLSEGGKVTTPLAEVAWAKLFGMVTDHYGVPWLILALN